MDPALLLALVETGKFALTAIHDLQTGAATPEELRARWQAVRDRLDSANALWEAAGETVAARAAEGHPYKPGEWPSDAKAAQKP